MKILVRRYDRDRITPKMAIKFARDALKETVDSCVFIWAMNGICAYKKNEKGNVIELTDEEFMEQSKAYNEILKKAKEDKEGKEEKK